MLYKSTASIIEIDGVDPTSENLEAGVRLRYPLSSHRCRVAIAAMFHELEVWKAENPGMGERPIPIVWYHKCRAKLIDDDVVSNLYHEDLCRNIIRDGLKKREAVQKEAAASDIV